jgi:hypothetical protein
MTVRTASVEIIDRDPIEPGSKVILHLAHDIAGEARRFVSWSPSSGATMKRN